MSLILDALKRAERERKLGQAPAALDELALPPAPPKRGPGRRPVVLSVAAVIIASLAVFAYLRSQHRVPAAVEPAAAAVVAEPVATSVAPAGEDSPSARIEDGAEIATLDDLTGDTAGSTDAAAASADTVASAEPADAVPKEPPPTLVTPSSLQAHAAPAPNSDARMAVKPEPAPAAKPAAIVASKPVAAAKPKAQPAPAVIAAVKPAAATKPAPAAKAIEAPAMPVEVAAAQPQAEVNAGPHVAPPGPVIRFGNGPMEVIEPPPRPVRVPPPPAAPPAPAPAADVAPAAAAPEPVAAQVDASTDAAAAAAPSTPVAEAAHSTSPAPVETPKPAPVAAQAPRRMAAPPPPPPARPDPYASTRRLKDMPPGYRAEFPPITIDVHAYNGNPQKRFVLINGRRYREGDVISEGPRIAQIVAEGIVFDWRNEQVLYGSR